MPNKCEPSARNALMQGVQEKQGALSASPSHRYRKKEGPAGYRIKEGLVKRTGVTWCLDEIVPDSWSAADCLRGA
eukprot:1161634-Pelagomonas_calceolata.AAC.1